MDELKDWSTSIGRSVSVCVGDGTGEEKRVVGNDSESGDEEKLMANRVLVSSAAVGRKCSLEGSVSGVEGGEE